MKTQAKSFDLTAYNPGTISHEELKTTLMSEPPRKPHHIQDRPIIEWLLGSDLEEYITEFMAHNITGPALLQLDTAKLKALGVNNNSDKATFKKKIKEMKAIIEKERRSAEKEAKAREKQLKKASKFKSK